MSDDTRSLASSDFPPLPTAPEITQESAARADALPPDLLSLAELLDACTTTRPEALAPFAGQLEGTGWTYSPAVQILSYYNITSEGSEPYLDAWTSQVTTSDDEGNYRWDGGALSKEYANQDAGRWILCFRANGTPPGPFTQALRLVSLRDGRLEFAYAEDITVFPTNIFGSRGNPEMDLYEIIPKVFVIGARQGYDQVGHGCHLGRYGSMRDVPPPEERAYVKWGGAATIRVKAGTTVDYGWCLRAV
ncbi:hypothetical protein ACFWTE_18075 [Nocardiopsis sp. NPDC058631]|uniref:hypothetical protein n=1 Tax=Nocardiopsis sp. NPDC058631 TaxID=3346566 RepID=UPI00364F3CA8